MNIAQLSEQLKDVPQNRLIDYARNPNSVVPQFLALAEIQRRQQLSAQVAPPAATVAEDVLAQAQPAPQQVGLPQMVAQQPAQMAQQLPENQPGVPQLQSGMGQGFAPGGLVAFADGGLSLDEDTDEDREMAQLFPTNRLAGITEMISALPGKAREFVSNLPKSYEETKRTSESAPSGSASVEDLIAKVRHLESRGQHYDSKGNIITSPKGAEGIMQVMRHTQRDPGYGVTPAKDKSPQELQRVGEDYFKAMLNEFKDPKLAAMAYNWGPGNVKKWLASDRQLPVPKETRQYAANFSKGGIASFAGPDGSYVEPESVSIGNRLLSDYLDSREEERKGNIDKSISDMFTLSQKRPSKGIDLLDQYNSQRQEYADNLARERNRGIRNLSAPNPVVSRNLPPMDYSDPMGGTGAFGESLIGSRPQERYGITPEMWKNTVAAANELAARKTSQNQLPPELQYPPKAKVASTSSATPNTQDFRDFDQASALFQAENANKGITQVAPKSKADLYAEALEKDIEAQAAKAAKAGDMNLALSIMQAGFKMLGSKSPYFMQGIGEGGEQGISTFAALKKQEADQAKDLMAARLGLYKYGAAQEAAAETREANRLYREGETSRKTSEAEDKASDRAFLRYGQRTKQIEDAVRKGYANNPMYNVSPEKFEGEIQAKIAAAKASDQLLNTLAERAGIGAPPQIQSGPVIVQTPKGAISFPSKEAADAFKRQAGIK